MRYNAVRGEAQPYTLEMYVTPDGTIPFEDWLLQLRDARAIARIRVRLDRLSLGNAGDAHPVGASVWELRIDYGPGYRVFMRGVAQRSCCCSMAGISVPKREISSRHRPIGTSTSRGDPMPKLTKNYQESLLQALQNPQEAAEYLTAALEDGDSA